jgi:hypothetical protein
MTPVVSPHGGIDEKSQEKFDGSEKIDVRDAH